MLPAGGADARARIREHEFKFPGQTGEVLAKRNVFRFNVLLTSYHVILADWVRTFILYSLAMISFTYAVLSLTAAPLV
jgi:hypothetical protein